MLLEEVVAALPVAAVVLPVVVLVIAVVAVEAEVCSSSFSIWDNRQELARDTAV